MTESKTFYQTRLNPDSFDIHFDPLEGALFQDVGQSRRGRRSRYPFRDMRTRQYIRVPKAETKQLFRATYYANKRLGIKLAAAFEAETQSWLIMRR